jgi:hypothetical protein
MADDLALVCDRHAERDECPDALIAHLRGGYGLYVRDGENGHAASVVEIAYCPWCGTRLPEIEEIDLSAFPPIGGA